MTEQDHAEHRVFIVEKNVHEGDFPEGTAEKDDLRYFHADPKGFADAIEYLRGERVQQYYFRCFERTSSGYLPSRQYLRVETRFLPITSYAPRARGRLTRARTRFKLDP